MADATNYNQTQYATAQKNGLTCVEAEENILRRMILRQGVAEDVVDELSQADFSNRDYGMIFNAIQALVAKQCQVDMISIDAEMTRLYGAGGWKPSVLIQAGKETDFTLSSWQELDDVVKLVRELSIRRQKLAELEKLVGDLRNPTKDLAEVMNAIGDLADGVETSDTAWKSIGEVMLDAYDYMERRQNGEIKSITSGLNCLDRIIGGFFAGEMTVVAARPSVGKSAFGVNVALAAAHEGFKVGVVSCEMSSESTGQRLLSHGAFVDGMKLRKGDIDDESWRRLSDALSEMGDMPIDFLHDCMAVEDVVNVVSKKARKGEIDLVVIDYLQFLETRKQFKEERLRVGYISHALKRLAKRAKIPVIALAQVTRQGEGVMPTMKMLQETGHIEQDADGIVFLHRPSSPDDASVNPEHKGGWGEWKEKDLTYLSIGVAKQRNGAIGQTNVLFDAGLMRYIEIVNDEERR